MERTLCSIEAGTGRDEQTYFLSTTVRDAGRSKDFTITLIQAQTLKGWSGQFGGDLKAQAKAMDMEEEEYVAQTGKALTRQDMGELTFEYQVKPTKRNGMELSWKKVVSSIKLQLGKVSLEPLDSTADAMKDILLHSIETAADLKGSISRLETENDRLSNERKHALQRLEKCVTQKEQMEGDLYNKFAAILNAKKAKIRELKERGRGVATVGSEGGDGDGGRRSTDVEEEDGEEAMDLDGEDVDTDEEREKEVCGRKRQKVAPASRLLDEDDGVVFDEDSPEKPAYKGRRRKREATSAKTAYNSSAKPAIPKVPSTGTPSSSRTSSSSNTPSTSRTPSMRKTPSREKSDMDSKDVDDLLGEM